MGVVFTPLAALALALLAHVLGEQAMAPEGYEAAFEAWKRRYHKSYATVEKQEAHFATFKKNYDSVKASNTQGRSFQLELNAFADKTSEEFAHGMGLMATKRRPLRDSVRFIGSHRPRQNVTLPTSVDWRKQGAVTPVKNQGTCGGCWAFSTIATLESAWSIATLGAGKQQLLSLSEQQLVDCAAENSGCDGGNPSLTFGFTEKSNICTEGSYPYKDFDHKEGEPPRSCGNSDCMVGIMVGNIKGFIDVSPDQQTLMDAIAQQPVTASIQAGGQTNPFQLYKGGVLSANCSGEVDHSVTIIGYGTEGNQPYWLVRNSWGADWGENGYARLLRGQPGEAGECMIRSDNAYPKVDATNINAWMNGSLPLGTLMGLVLGGIVVLVFGVMFVMRKCKNRGAPVGAVGWNGSRPLVSPSSTSLQATTRPIPIPAFVATPSSITSSVPQASGPKGNSARSRLL